MHILSKILFQCIFPTPGFTYYLGSSPIILGILPIYLGISYINLGISPIILGISSIN